MGIFILWIMVMNRYRLADIAPDSNLRICDRARQIRTHGRVNNYGRVLPSGHRMISPHMSWA